MQHQRGITKQRLFSSFLPPEQHGSRSLGIALFSGLLGLILAYSATKAAFVSTLIAPIILIAGVWLIIIAWRKWQSGIQALLVLLIIEGAIRKWFLPWASEFVYFYKDILMLVILFSYLKQRHKPVLLVKENLKIFSVTVTSLGLYLLASLGNSKLPHPLIGLIGIKTYLLYIPLVFLVPRMFTTKEKLIHFLKWYLIIALPVVALSALQFADSDSTSQLNKYAWTEDAAVGGGSTITGVTEFQDSKGNSFVRVTGPFSYISGLGLYLPTMFALLLGLISLPSVQALPNSYKWLYYIALMGVATTSFMTGSRASVVQLVFILVVFYGLSSWKDLLLRLRQVMIGAVLIYISLTIIFPQAYDALYTRAFRSESEVEEGQGRILDAFSLPLNEAEYAGAFGYGVGATQNSVAVLMSKLNLPFWGERIGVGFEQEPARLVLELGIVGYILYGLVKFVLLISLWRACYTIRDNDSKTLAYSAFAILFIYLFFGGAIVSHLQNVFQWFLAGVCFALWNCDKGRFLVGLRAQKASGASVLPHKLTYQPRGF